MTRRPNVSTAGYAAAFLLAFLALVTIVPGDALGEVLNGIRLAVAVGVLVTYGPALWGALCHPEPRSEEYLLLGIGTAWFGSALHGAVSMAWRNMDKPPWLTAHWSWNLFIFLAIIGGTLHMTAPNAINGRVPLQNWVRWGVAVTCGVSISLLLAWIF